VTEQPSSKADNTSDAVIAPSYLRLEHWRRLWEFVPLALDPGGLFRYTQYSPTSLRTRGQDLFKYTFLPSPTEVPFKNKIMTEQPSSKVDNTSDVVIDRNDVISTDLRSKQLSTHFQQSGAWSSFQHQHSNFVLICSYQLQSSYS